MGEDLCNGSGDEYLASMPSVSPADGCIAHAFEALPTGQLECQSLGSDEVSVEGRATLSEPMNLDVLLCSCTR